MEREAINQLLAWKQSHRRKPLIVEGARQVGKTWLVKEFGRLHYDSVAYINFEEQIYLRSLFHDDYDVERIITRLNAALHTHIEAGRTLIFFDEVQEAENGLTALKYFSENAPEQHVIAAGSLLGIEMHRSKSFPVGKVQFMKLYPMSFVEFLRAQGEESLVNMMTDGDWKGIKLFAPRLREKLRQYYYVGGMPEAVSEFVATGNWAEVRSIQRDILQSYDRDFSKHAPEDIVPRIRQLWLSLPTQLSRENRKFLYGLVKEGARAREYELALQWLFDAGLIYRVSNVKAPRLPLAAYEDYSAFKIYSLDVGLLGAMSGLDQATVVNGNAVFTEFKGALTEQYVLQQLILEGKPYYWSKANSRQEVDFIMEREGVMLPIEVKAEENLKAKSLRQFSEEQKVAMAYRLSMSDYREESWVTNVPLYAAFMVMKMR
ncbi:MAG: ATP-binding protein [Muribaculaceae bacterium]